MERPGVAPAPREQLVVVQTQTPNAQSNVPPSPHAAAAQPPVVGNVDWHELVGQLKLGGMARMLAQHCEIAGHDANRMELRVHEAHRHLLEKPYRDKLQSAVEEHFGRRVRLEFTLGEATGNTPAERADQERQTRQRGAIEAIAIRSCANWWRISMPE
jgi:DNA polymerase III subunit gamma/tau